MPELPLLAPIDQRILGALLEKERTVPSTYPLTLNGLRSACNQTSSRDPVTDYDERTLEHALSELKLRGLLRFEHTGTGSRVMKYRQLLSELLELADDERAVLTVLLLRGEQSAGELRTRTDRLHAFADNAQVDDCLHRMARRSGPLVQELPRRSGQRDTRWKHLLDGTAPEVAPPEVTTPFDHDARDARVVATYEAVAATYADMLLDELDHKPFDRWFLARVAELAAGRPIADIGCGPGHVTAMLAAANPDVVGFDISPAMVDVARRAFPALRFSVGDFRALPSPAGGGAWGAIVALYAFVHMATDELDATFATLAEALAPGGWLTVATHVGPEVRHRDDWWGHPVDIDFVLHEPRAVRAAVARAGFEVVEWYVRAPIDGIEVATDRLYLIARR